LEGKSFRTYAWTGTTKSQTNGSDIYYKLLYWFTEITEEYERSRSLLVIPTLTTTLSFSLKSIKGRVLIEK